jgi:hypothetical protein
MKCLETAFAEDVGGALLAFRAGRQMMADDPNGRMKAARDAMNKTVVSQFEIRSS